MDCTRIDLIGYHFATLPDDSRDEVEAHLVTCRACLRAFLALKRHADDVAGGARPSDEARRRLRQEVVRTFAPKPTRGLPAWLSRPIPLYQGLAGATIVLLCATLAPALRESWLAMSPRTSVVSHRDDGAAIDTARTTAESNAIY
jgi:anti-sigma factor RsiW